MLYNCAVFISGLEKLSALVSLNLEGNSIALIPVWMSKKLKALKNLKLADNNINSVRDRVFFTMQHALLTIYVGLEFFVYFLKFHPWDSRPTYRGFEIVMLNSFYSLGYLLYTVLLYIVM